MSYDFAIVRPADLCALGLTPPVDDAAIARFYDDDYEKAAAPRSLVEFTEALLERVPFGDENETTDENHWLMVDPGAYRTMAQVAASWDFVPQALATILELTFDRGLAVLDPQSRILFDPTDSIWVQVTTDGAMSSPYLSRGLLDQFVNLAAAKNGFIVISEEDEYVYAQTRYTDGTFEVEHRGGEDAHFASTTTDAALVAEILWSWVSDGEEWRTALPWHRIRV
ncbi:hypothetical protein BH11ACT2_BH11ACT2_00790 [soil metagenome]